MSPRCELFVVMGKTDPAAERHRQLDDPRPRDAAGVTVTRGLKVFGFSEGPHGGHAEIEFQDVRVPVGSSWPVKATASRSRRPAWAQGASITACG